jgi:hypothetical protein
MILSKRMADHKPHDMVCELVDNALDADAKRVWIELGRRSLTVADDGTGMEDINDAIRFGKGTRAGRRGGVLGRYGVGMTDALCKLGPKAEIATLRRAELRRLRVDWEECLRNEHFPFLAEGRPTPCRELTLFETVHVSAGTRVHIHGQAPGLQLDRLCRILTERYTPGIWQGREILVRRESQDWIAIEDMNPGPLDDVIEYDGVIEGRPYHVYGGLMRERSVVYNRAFLGYAYRFVEETTELFKGVSTAHLQVFLGEGWRDCLGTHKNRLELYREELFEDIRSRAKEWLEAAARKSEALQLSSLALELEEYLTRMSEARGADAVAARRPEARPGERQPRGAAARRRTRSPAEGAAGDTSTPRPQRGIQIAWDPALRQMGELRVSPDGPGPHHQRLRGAVRRAWRGERPARLRAGVVRGADPGLREHELYAYYYDRVDQPAVAHEPD